MKRMLSLGAVTSVLLGCSSSDVTDASTDSPVTVDGGAEGGADGGPATSVDYKSGTRLRAKVWTSPDGARVFHGFYDSQLKVDCTVVLADDATLRCLPTSLRAGLIYADASCKTPVGFTYDSCPAPAYVSHASASGCGTSIYPAKGPSAAGSFFDQGMTCAPYLGTVKAPFDLGPKMDPAAFVKGARTREARGADLMMESYDMEDGARMPIGDFDTARKSQCAVQPTLSIGVGRCVPTHVGYGEGQFADSSCTKAAAYVPDNACSYASDDALASAWVYGKTAACNGDMLVGWASVGAPLATVYQKGGNSCTTYSAPGMFVPITADLPDTALPKAAPAPDGAGRVQRYVDRAGTGEKLFAEGFYDTTLGTACNASVASDGKLRCIPVGQGIGWYLDAACTQPLFAATDPGPACPYNCRPRGCRRPRSTRSRAPPRRRRAATRSARRSRARRRSTR